MVANYPLQEKEKYTDSIFKIYIYDFASAAHRSTIFFALKKY